MKKSYNLYIPGICRIAELHCYICPDVSEPREYGQLRETELIESFCLIYIVISLTLL